MSDVIKLNIKSKKLRTVSANQERTSVVEKIDEDTLAQKLSIAANKGFEEGYQKGVEEKTEEYETILLEKNEDFYNLLSELEGKFIEFEQDFSRIVIDVSIKIASKILKKEIDKDSIIESSLSEALRQVISANQIIVRLNHVDKNKLELQKQSIGEGNKFSKLQFEADDSIEIGGCYVETELGNVDGTIAKQLNEIMKQFELKFLVQEENVSS